MGLLEDTVLGARRKVVTGFAGNRDESGLRWMLVLAVTDAGAVEIPAVGFDEFDDVVENGFYGNEYSDLKELTFSQHVKRFSKQLEKERGITAYIIYYQARITYTNPRWNFVNNVNGINYQIKYNERVKIENVLTVNGGYRENNTFEFFSVV